MKPNTVEWLDFAKADLLGESVLPETPSFEYLVAFHCHQGRRGSVRKL